MSRPPETTNPFKALTREIAEKVLTDYRIKAQAQRRLKRLLDSYGEMVQDPRYAAIRQELKLILGDYLRDLVQQATTCSHCASKAAPIHVLQQAVAEPLEEVWFSKEQDISKDEGEADVAEDEPD